MFPKIEGAMRSWLPAGAGGGGGAGGAGGEGGRGSFATRFWAGYATMCLATMVTHPLDTLCAARPPNPPRASPLSS
jgi:hypothetical protein